MFVVLCELIPSFQTVAEPPGWETPDPHYLSAISNTTEITIKSVSHANLNKCSLELKDCTYENCFAFCSYTESGIGGAIFCYESDIFIEKSHFNRNQASLGGAIAISNSPIYLSNTKFEYNTAYISGGGFYCEKQDIKAHTHPSINIIKCEFNNNNGGDDGGAVTFYNLDDNYIEESHFQGNIARLRGGAIFTSESKLSLYKVQFDNNSITSETKFNKITSEKYHIPVNKYNFRGRGGGAINFFARNNINLELQTSDCNFTSNNVTNGTNLDTHYHNPGYHIMFDGFASWTSNNDFFNPCLIQNGYSHVRRENTTAILIRMINQSNQNCEEFDNLSTATHFTYQSPNFTTAMYTSPVPTPTTFIYSATAISRLPLPTTSSYTPNPTTKKFTPPTRHDFTAVSSYTITTPAPTQDQRKTKLTYHYTYNDKESNKQTISYFNYTTTLSNIATNLYISTSTLTLTIQDNTTTYIPTNTFVLTPTNIMTQLPTTIFVPYSTVINAPGIQISTTNAANEEIFYVPKWEENVSTLVPTLSNIYTIIPIYTHVNNAENDKEYYVKENSQIVTVVNSSLSLIETETFIKTKNNNKNRALRENNEYYTIQNYDITSTSGTTFINSNVPTFTYTTISFQITQSLFVPPSDINLTTTQISTLTTTYSNVTSFISSNFKNDATSTSFVTYVNTSSFFKMYIFNGTSVGTTYTCTSTFVETAILLSPNQVTSVASTTIVNTTTATVTLISTTAYLGLSKSITNASTHTYIVVSTNTSIITNVIQNYNTSFAPYTTEIPTISKTYSNTFTLTNYSNTSTIVYKYTEVDTITKINTTIYHKEIYVGTNQPIETSTVHQTNTSYFSWTGVTNSLDLIPKATQNLLYTIIPTNSTSETFAKNILIKTYHSTDFQSPPSSIIQRTTTHTLTFTYNSGTRTYTNTDYLYYMQVLNSDSRTNGYIITQITGDTYVSQNLKINTTLITSMLTATFVATNSFNASQVSSITLMEIDTHQFSYPTMILLYTYSTTTMPTFINVSNSYFYTENVITNKITSFYSILYDRPNETLYNTTTGIILSPSLVDIQNLTITIVSTPGPTPAPTRSQTPPQTPSPSASTIPSSDGYSISTEVIKSETQSQKETLSNTTILTEFSTISYLDDGNTTHVPYYTYIVTQVISYTYTIVITEIVRQVYVKSGITSAFLIGAVTAGLAVFFIIAAIALHLYRSTYQNNESDFYSDYTSSETSSNEMPSEMTRSQLISNIDTIAEIPQDIQVPIENYDEDMEFINGDF